MSSLVSQHFLLFPNPKSSVCSWGSNNKFHLTSCFHNISIFFILRRWFLYDVQWFTEKTTIVLFKLPVGLFHGNRLVLVLYTLCSSKTMSFLQGQMVGTFSARSTSSLILSSSSPTGAPFSRNTSNDCSASWKFLFIKSWPVCFIKIWLMFSVEICVL